jgi:hypothetical protein
MRKLLHKLFDPTDPATLLLAPLIAYFVWWGCASTAAPTLRPASPLPAGHTTQVGATANASASLLNAGIGGTVFGQYRPLDAPLELGGYLEFGGVTSPVFATAVTMGGPVPVGGVIGGGAAARYTLELDRLRVGGELHLAAAHTTGFVSGSFANLGLYQGYLGLPASFRITENFDMFTNPAVGGVMLMLWDGPYTQGIPLPTFRLPLGAQFRLSPNATLITEVGLAGAVPVAISPYGSLGVTFSY